MFWLPDPYCLPPFPGEENPWAKTHQYENNGDQIELLPDVGIHYQKETGDPEKEDQHNTKYHIERKKFVPRSFQHNIRGYGLTLLCHAVIYCDPIIN